MSVKNRGFELEQRSYDDFRFIFLAQHRELFSDPSDLEKIIEIGRLALGDYLLQVVIKATTVLVAIFYQKKCIRVYSPRMSSELFLIRMVPPALLDKDFVTHVGEGLKLDGQERPSEYRQITKLYKLPDVTIPTVLTDQLKEKHKELIEELSQQVKKYRPSFLEKISDYILQLTTNYSVLRIYLLKFLVVLPTLSGDKKGKLVKKALLESLGQVLGAKEKQLGFLLKTVIRIIEIVARICPAKFLAILIRVAVRFQARRFISGTDIRDAQKSLGKLSQSHRDYTIDQLGELVISEHEADRYRDQILDLIEGLDISQRNCADIPKAHLSIKISALCSDFRPQALEFTYAKLAPRLREILILAKRKNVFINIDAEHFSFRDTVFQIYKRVLLDTPELTDWKDTGIVVQAYLRDAVIHLREILAFVKQRKMRMPIRLVKGAYWDMETIEADAHGFRAFQFLNKEESDLHFRQLIIEILKNNQHLQLCLASHNLEDHCFAKAYQQTFYSDSIAIEHQCLHMTYEGLSLGMVEMGWVVRNYVPIGDLLVGMAYLVRRIMENSSQVGVLTAVRLIDKKKIPLEERYLKKERQNLLYTQDIHATANKFSNVTPLRLYKKQELRVMDMSLNKHWGEFKNSFELSGEKTEIYSPSYPNRLVGYCRFAHLEDVTRAIEASLHCYRNTWAKTDWSARSEILLKVALRLHTLRTEIATLIVFESGKTVEEALADVDEAIDFLNYYARQIRELKLDKIAPRGVVAVISPWNFPLAIPCGMVAAALVCGNTVILKSAENTPLVASWLVDIFHSQGLPPDACIHLPGFGEQIGARLTQSDQISTFAFTGSKTVGLSIWKQVAGHLCSEGNMTVNVVTEMGGKNSVIVESSADIDEAIVAILYSAFAHGGQKCSAASRIFVQETIANAFKNRFIYACRDLQVGVSDRFETYINPLISAKEKEKVRGEIQKAIKEARDCGGEVLINRSDEEFPHHAIGPVVIELPLKRFLSAKSISQKELFSPVVHLAVFGQLKEAIDVINSSQYALTAGIFSQLNSDIDYWISKIQAGNLYVNRSITGARVGVEPFGGFKYSGTGPKAGGRDYLNAFLNFNQELEKIEDKKLEEGEQQDFSLAKTSSMPTRICLKKVAHLIDLLVMDAQNIFGETSSNKTLRELASWLQIKALDFLSSGRKNQHIVGQESYDNFLLTRSQVVVFSSGIVSTQTLIRVLTALSLRAAVSVFARNKESYHWWKTMSTYYQKAGLDSESFKIIFTTEEKMKQSLDNFNFDLALLDGSLRFIDQNSHLLKRREGMLKILSNHQSDLSFEQTCLHFIFIRSLAINTMRYGALLSLDNEV